MTKPATTDEYLASLSDDQRETIERLRAAIRAAVPRAREKVSYGIPGFTLDGRPLAWVAAWKRHYSLYPVSAEEVVALAEPGEEYEVEKGTIRFRAGATLPYALVARIVRARAAAIAAGAR